MNKKVLIVGGGIAGLKAAITAIDAEPTLDVKLFTRSKLISWKGSELPYFAAGDANNIDAILDKEIVAQGSLANIDIIYHSDVTQIHPEKQRILVQDLITGQELPYSYDSLILATGATITAPDVDGVNLNNVFFLKTLEDALQIRELVDNGTVRKAVISGENITALQLAYNLWMLGVPVTIVMENESFLPEFDSEIADLVIRNIVDKGIDVIKGEGIRALIGNAKGDVVEVHTPEQILPADLVIWTEKYQPDVSLVKEVGITTGTTGAIIVNEFMETNVPNIYCAGDCVEVTHLVTQKPKWIPTGSAAVRMGYTAGLNAVSRENREAFEGVMGTINLKSFDLTIAKTGLSCTESKEAGFNPEMVMIPLNEQQGMQGIYKDDIILLVADRDSHRVLGLQGIGGSVVSDAVDVIAASIHKGVVVEELASMDLSYSPAYTNQLHPVIKAASLLKIKLKGELEGISAVSLSKDLGSTDLVMVDIRTAAEVMLGTLPGAKHIALEELKARMNELNPDKRIVLICKDGQRSYKANYMLKSSGYERVSILDGGIMSYPYTLE